MKKTLIEKILQEIAKLIPILSFLVKKVEDTTKTMDEPTNEEKPEIEKLKWDIPKDACHSFRTICDKIGLSVNEKNMLAKVLNCESGFDIKAVRKNKNGTTDYSICQFNDYWWIGEGKPFSSPQDVFDNPEKQVRILIEEYKKGNLKWWICYKNGRYQNFASKIA